MWFGTMTPNGLALGEEADFEALNCLPALNLIRSTKLHLSTEPAFLPNACYRFGVLFRPLVCRSALAKTYSFAIFGGVLAGANCKCVWLLAWA
jgi:hypothetical protein